MSIVYLPNKKRFRKEDPDEESAIGIIRRIPHLPQGGYQFFNGDSIFNGDSVFSRAAIVAVKYQRLKELTAIVKSKTVENHFSDAGTEVFRDIKQSQIMQFFLSSKVISYVIDAVEDLDFVARGGSKFGASVKLHMDPKRMIEISLLKMTATLGQGIYNGEYSLHELSELFSSAFQELTNPNESKIEHLLLANVIGPLCKCFGLRCEPKQALRIKDSPLIAHENQSGVLYPDVLIYNKQNDPTCAIEIKRPCIFRKGNRNNLTKEDLCKDKMKEIMKQLFSYMIVAKIRLGMVIDAYFLILVEFTEDRKGYRREFLRRLSNGQWVVSLGPNQTLTVKSETRILDVNSDCPSFFEGIAYLLIRARETKSRQDETTSRNIDIDLATGTSVQ